MHKVQPIYPDEAKRALVEGNVMLAVIIDKDGTTQDPRVIDSASPLLNEAALKAVKQWRYRPFLIKRKARRGGHHHHDQLCDQIGRSEYSSYTALTFANRDQTRSISSEARLPLRYLRTLFRNLVFPQTR